MEFPSSQIPIFVKAPLHKNLNYIKKLMNI